MYTKREPEAAGARHSLCVLTSLLNVKSMRAHRSKVPVSAPIPFMRSVKRWEYGTTSSADIQFSRSHIMGRPPGCVQDVVHDKSVFLACLISLTGNPECVQSRERTFFQTHCAYVVHGNADNPASSIHVKGSVTRCVHYKREI
jgi:hypothetical protein